MKTFSQNIHQSQTPK